VEPNDEAARGNNDDAASTTFVKRKAAFHAGAENARCSRGGVGVLPSSRVAFGPLFRRLSHRLRTGSQPERRSRAERAKNVLSL